MNHRVTRKIKQAMRRNWREFYGDILLLPFQNRLAIAWYILTHSKKTHSKKRNNQ